MAMFPSLEPATRSYSLGDFPITRQAAHGTTAIRFRHGYSAVLPPLTLTFQLLTDDEGQLIDDHYTQHDTKISFRLPLAIFRGNSNAGGPALLSAKWRYASAPQTTSRKGGLRDVSVQLESVG